MPGVRAWRHFVLMLLLIAGCASPSDVQLIRDYGGLIVGSGRGGADVRSLPVDSISFDPTKRPIDDQTFAALLPALRRTPMIRLNLSGQPITDAAIAGLNALTSLRVLEVNGTQISVDRLKALRLPNLRQINVSADKIDDVDAEQMPSALAKRFIAYESSDAKMNDAQAT